MQLEARLRAFAAFARRHSFSDAAEELRISQPAVSKHIAEIERELGMLLVERRKRGCVLTATGEFFANHVLRAEAILAQGLRGLAELRQPGTGALAIVASGITGTYLLPEVVATFERANPGVQVSLELATTARAVEAVRAHRAELGVVGGFVTAPEVRAEPLVEDEIVVVGPRSLAGRRLSRAELGAMKWISREEGSATRALVEATCTNLGIAPSRRLILPSWEAIKLAVKRGDGIAGCSRFAIEDELRRGSLGIIRVPRWNARKMMSIVCVRDAALTPCAQQFLVMLRARWSQMGSRSVRRNPSTAGDRANLR
jgi:LysR family transcriptional regulator, transcriptional activator of the cysJI operon